MILRMPVTSVWFNQDVLEWIDRSKGDFNRNRTINTLLKHLKNTDSDGSYVQAILKSYQVSP